MDLSPDGEVLATASEAVGLVGPIRHVTGSLIRYIGYIDTGIFYEQLRQDRRITTRRGPCYNILSGNLTV
jgi:hypothetical protein